MTQRGVFFPTLLLILAILILWSPDFLWRLTDLSKPGSAIEGEVEVLRAENSHLKSQLAKLDSEIQTQTLPFEAIRANVYSRYPLNFKHELVINKGSRDRVRVRGAVVIPVLRESGLSSQVFLVGSVSSVLGSRSFIQTIFDYRFKEAVHIGTGKVSGLLIGGLSPTIMLIPKDAKISSGDVVISASPELPYGVILGRLKEVRSSSDQLFREASLELLYDINNLTVVAVEVNERP